MKRLKIIILFAALPLAFARAQAPQPVLAPAANQPPPAAAAPVSAAAVRAQLTGAKPNDIYTAELIGRKGSDVYMRTLEAAQTQGHVTVNAGKITKIKFEFQYDELETDRFANERRWLDAARVILKAIAPLMPYLDIATNNASGPALEAADYLFKAGDALQQQGGEQNEKQAGLAHTQAQKIFQQAGAMQWFEGAYNANLKAVMCLVRLNNADQAAEQFEKLTPCEDVEDRDYGLYWLVRAAIQFKQQDFREALDAAVKSLVFKNKSTETFPDALLMSAHCYYELQEMYRARDVYYEVARLFDNTDWSAAARKQLALIMKNSLTKNKERSDYWNILIETREDMNSLVEEYLKTAGKENLTGAPTITNKPTEESKTP